MRKTPLLVTASQIAMTPIERRIGRLMRGPDGHTDDGTGNNDDGTGGNKSDSTQEEKKPDNTGQDDELKGFWDEEDGGKKDGPSGESDPDDDSPSSADIAKDVGDQLKALNFGDFMTPEMSEKLSNGDASDFNTTMNSFGQQVAQKTLVMTVGLMKHFRGEIMKEAKQLVSGSLSASDDYKELVAAIPSAAKKEMGPTIRTIYDRALTRAKGDRKVAIQQTKDVLKLQAESFGSDLDLEVAPRTAEDRHNAPPKAVNWLEELSSR